MDNSHGADKNKIQSDFNVGQFFLIEITEHGGWRVERIWSMALVIAITSELAFDG